MVPRSIGPVVYDSHDRTGQRRFVCHVVHQNEPLPLANRTLTLATIVDGQSSIRVELYEQAGAVESAQLPENRLVLDGEVADLPAELPAGSPVELTLTLGPDARLGLSAVEPASGASLTVSAYIDGVLDRAGRERAAQRLARLAVRV